MREKSWVGTGIWTLNLPTWIFWLKRSLPLGSLWPSRDPKTGNHLPLEDHSLAVVAQQLAQSVIRPHLERVQPVWVTATALLTSYCHRAHSFCKDFRAKLCWLYSPGGIMTKKYRKKKWVDFYNLVWKWREMKFGTGIMKSHGTVLYLDTRVRCGLCKSEFVLLLSFEIA